MLKQIIVGLAALFTLGATALAHADAAPTAQVEKQAAATGTVNINTASEAEIADLPGIGPSKATNVVTYRQRHGAFARVEDIMKVKGFGRKVFAHLKQYLSTEGQTTYRNPKKVPTMSAIMPTPFGRQ
jgi:competence protein ComEA